MKKEVQESFVQIIRNIYPHEVSQIIEEISLLISPLPKKQKTITQEDVILLTYPDHIFEQDTPTLQTLTKIINRDFTFAKIVHILPFHPSTSDEGFSISDFNSIESKFGSWNTIHELSKTKKIMADIVLNHVSQKHPWFEKCKEGNAYYKQFFHIYDVVPFKPDIFRARTTPLFSPKKIANENKYVWTTFSQDQVDINYTSHYPLIHFLKIIRNYAIHDISFFRLDALAYIIKEKTGVHQNKTYLILELLTLFTKQLNPHFMIIPEVNFSYEQNHKYLLKSDAIYHFELPALLLYTFYNNDHTALSRWLFTRTYEKEKFLLNFTSTHDGISLLGIRKILKQKEFDTFIESITKKNSVISYKSSGTKNIPYEANGLFQNILDNPQAYISCKLITLALRGIPLFYLPDFFTVQNWTQGYIDSNRPRDLSRQKFSLHQYEMLKEFMSKPLQLLSHAAHIRTQEVVFHPNCEQEIIETKKELFIVKRYNNTTQIYCITNVTNKKQQYRLGTHSTDILTHKVFEKHITIDAYATVWCKIQK